MTIIKKSLAVCCTQHTDNL